MTMSVGVGRSPPTPPAPGGIAAGVGVGVAAGVRVGGAVPVGDAVGCIVGCGTPESPAPPPSSPA